jgi:phage-related protein
MLLRRLQDGEAIGMPASRPMPSIGPRCHELRVRDAGHYWRIIYRIDPDAIVVPCIFHKGTRKTPKQEIELSRKRLADYDAE